MGGMKAVLTIVIGILGVFSLAYGGYLFIVTATFQNKGFTVLVAYMMLATLVGTGSMIRALYE